MPVGFADDRLIVGLGVVLGAADGDLGAAETPVGLAWTVDPSDDGPAAGGGPPLQPASSTIVGSIAQQRRPFGRLLTAKRPPLISSASGAGVYDRFFGRIQAEGGVGSDDGAVDVVLINHDGDPDLGRRDHLDVDAGRRERCEEPR